MSFSGLKRRGSWKGSSRQDKPAISWRNRHQC